jgi:hypothetical protein
VVSSDLLLAQVDVTETDIGVIGIALDYGVPSRRLLSSSPSAGTGNPSYEKCLARVDFSLYDLVEIISG